MTFPQLASWRHSRTFLCYLFLAGYPLLLNTPLYAATSNIDSNKKNLQYNDPLFGSKIDEVIVTSIGYLSALEMPKSVSVITAIDIEQSGASNIAEFLSREANITFTSYSGNTKFSRLDVRGSGETSVSNVVTLIDGVRVNTPDLAGTDFSIISMNQIERIEIVRGANSVRFGSGATLGVINIITKHAVQNEFKLTQFIKSYDTHATSLSSSIATNHHQFLLAGKVEESDGYRQHNDFLNKDLLLSYDYRFDPDNRISFKSQYHFDEYELPGPIAISELEKGVSRRSGSEIGLEGETKEISNLLHFNLKPLEQLQISSLFQYRERENYYWTGTNSSAKKNNENLIDLTTFTGNLLLNWKSLKLPLSISGGIDYEKADYFRTNNGVEKVFQNSRNVGGFISRGAFIHAEYEFLERLSLSGGYRTNVTDSNFEVQTIDIDIESPSCEFEPHPVIPTLMRPVAGTCPIALLKTKVQNDEWKSEVFEIGAVFDLTNELHFYASVATSFRNPNIDELALATTDKENLGTLRPQTSDHYETGIKYSGDGLSASLGFFKAKTKDEIIFLPTFGPGAGTNHNFNEAIIRRGFELETRLYPNDSFVIQWNFGYVDAKSESNNHIPLVAKFNTSLFYGWTFNSLFSLYAETKYVDERFDGNNFLNTGENKLSSYSTTNTHITIKDKSEIFSLLLSINNLLNEQYFSTGFNGTVYPAPERNYSVGVRFEL